MGSRLRIAVMSDLHVWRDVAPDSWTLAKRAVDAALRARVDHVVIAGDVFDCATAFEEEAGVFQRMLERRGLWHRDRLTIVPGNHDLFHTAHRGSLARRALEFSKAARAGAQETFDRFCAWAGALIDPGDRLKRRCPLPFAKRLDHVLLLGADTTGVDTAHSVNGYWRKGDDALLRDAQLEGSRTVLSIHHPPERDEERTLLGQIKDGFAFGFPPPDYRRLQRFADEVQLDAVVCGHIHDNGGAPWTWTLGEATEVFMVGRTGAVHLATARFGILSVPVRGALDWKVCAF